MTPEEMAQWWAENRIPLKLTPQRMLIELPIRAIVELIRTQQITYAELMMVQEFIPKKEPGKHDRS